MNSVYAFLIQGYTTFNADVREQIRITVINARFIDILIHMFLFKVDCDTSVADKRLYQWKRRGKYNFSYFQNYFIQNILIIVQVFNAS